MIEAPKPPSQTRFLEQLIPDFEACELNDELHILEDFKVGLSSSKKKFVLFASLKAL